MKGTYHGIPYTAVKYSDAMGDIWWCFSVEHHTDKYDLSLSGDGYSTWPEAYKALKEAIGAALKSGAPSKPEPAKASAAAAGPQAEATFEDMGGWKLWSYPDGTFGWSLKNGQSKSGYKTKGWAKKYGAKAAEQLAEDEAFAALVKEKFAAKYGQKESSVLAQDATQQAEKQLAIEGLSQKLSGVYSQASAEIKEKLAGALSEYEKELAQQQQKLEAGKLSEGAYNQWKQIKLAEVQQKQDLVTAMAEALNSADKTAAAIMNGGCPLQVAEGVNFGTYQVEGVGSVDTTFALYDSMTVQMLATKEPDLLPQAKVDEPKNLTWCRQKLTSAITQGILQGEGVEAIAARLRSVSDMDERQSLRNARTMYTSAQNRGRMYAYKRAQRLGVDVKKQWLSTLDGATRNSHRHLDGEKRDIEEPFSNLCQYPGDPAGPAAEVYNCRCTLVPAVEGVDYSGDLRPNDLDGLSYEEWREVKMPAYQAEVLGLESRRASIAESLASVRSEMKALNRTYSNIWKQDVTLADWDEKHAAVPAKLEFFEQKLSVAEWSYQKEKWQGLIDATREFDELGERYSALMSREKGLLSAQKAVTGKLSKLGFGNVSKAKANRWADAYTEERKAAARRFTDKYAANRAYRHYTKALWKTATAAEKHAATDYTAGSGKFNRPLAGHSEYWGNYKGVGKVDLDQEGGEQEIYALTSLIARSTFEEDIWVARGSDNDALEAFLGIPYGSLRSMSNADLQEYVGVPGKMSSFTSTGVTSGTAFSKSVRYEIYCPAGSQMLYVEPASVYGGGHRNHEYSAWSWDGEKDAVSVGNEAEIIQQRGATMVPVVIEKNGYNIKVVLELHPEYGYDTWTQ